MYRGRFAPSPSGPLHFGSLVAAVGSYLEAKTQSAVDNSEHNSEWLVRIEDLDAPRVVAGAADGILRSLEAFGMAWDGPVMFQSTRTEAYHAALEQLRARGVLYGCACTRREIADSSLRGMDGAVYPGTCREGLPPGRSARATRLRTQGAKVSFNDNIQGAITQDVEREAGDFVVARADGVIAYQLAVVVDDAAQGITGVVRGADLLEATPRQILLQRLLRLPTPRYTHLPVAVNAAGEKLSKQTHARAVNPDRPAPQLVSVLRFLGQTTPLALTRAPVSEVWDWAIANWRLMQTSGRQACAPPGESAGPGSR